MNIPTLWQSIRLEQAIDDMQPGFAQRPGETNAGVPQLRTNNVSPEGNIDLTELKYVIATPDDIEKYGVQVGDVIFNNTNSVEWVGKTAYYAEEGTYVLSNHMTRIRVNLDVLDPKYLARYLHFLWQTGRSQRFAKQWVNQAAIDRSALSSFELILPPLSEQRRIAAILHEADNLRGLRRSTDERARDLLPALFQEMFGDPIHNDRGWPKRRLDRLGKVTTGNTPPRNEPHNYGSFIDWIKSDNLESPLEYVTSSKEMLSQVGAKKGRIASKGSTLITCIAGSPDSIGKSAFADRAVAFNQQINAVTPNTDVAPYYLYVAIKLTKPVIQTMSSGGMKGIVPKSRLEELELPYPSKSLQDQFEVLAIEAIEQQKERAEAESQIEKLIESLLARAFTGELTAAWREVHSDQLRDEAVQRDIALGLRGTEPTLGDLEDGRVTQAEQEEADRLLAQALEQFRSIPSAAFQGLVSETFGDAPTISIETILSPQNQMLEALRVETSELFTEQLRPVAQALAQRLVRYTESLAQLQAEALRQPMLQAAPELTRQLATWFSSIGRLGEVAQALATRKPLRDVLGNDIAVLLDAISAAPAYFRADMLENDEISLIQAEEGLGLLGALGIVRPVQVRGQAGYRLVSREREQAVPEGLGL